MGNIRTSESEKRRSASFKLLRLPPEIRQHIFHAALALPAVDHLSLLCASRQINKEARESYYKRPLKFSSQSALVAFTAHRQPRDLSQVFNMQLRLEDLDSSSMQAYLGRVVLGLPLNARDHPYLREGQRIVSCLENLPHVKHLALLPPFAQSENPPVGLVASNIMCWAQRQHKHLESLNLSFETVSLEQLRGMSKLRSLTFTGYSSCTSSETLNVLNELSNLEHLYITGLPQTRQWRQQHGYSDKVTQSFTAEVLRHINPLTTLRISETTSHTRSQDPVFLTISMIRAISQTHLESLQHLHLSSQVTPTTTVLEHDSAIIRLLPDLRALTLEWPDFDAHIVTFLPPSIQHLTIAVQSHAHAQTVIKTLRPCAHRLPHLKRITFNTSSHVSKTRPVGEKAVATFDRPVQSTRPQALKTPWTISWGAVADE